jgi:hypothetical protein
MKSRSRSVLAPTAFAFWMAASPSGRLGAGGGLCGLLSRLSATPQYAMPHSVSPAEIADLNRWLLGALSA